MKKSFKILSISSILTLSINLVGCFLADNIKIQERGRFESAVIKYFEENQKDGKAVATFRDLTDFDWDKVYVFTGRGISEDFKNQIEYDNRYGKPFSGIIFLKDDEIVYDEIFPLYHVNMEETQLFYIVILGENVHDAFFTGTEKFVIYSSKNNYIDNQLVYDMYPYDEWYKNGMDELYKSN